jgi:hypothetical protein
MAEHFKIAAYWMARRETADVCVDRLCRFLADLEGCSPAFATWYALGRSRKGALKQQINVSDREYMLSALNKGRNKRDADGAVIDDLGFGVGFWNGGAGGSDVGLMIRCGLYSAKLVNAITIDLDDLPGAGAFAESAICVLRALALAWEPDWAGVMSAASMKAREFNARTPFIDWLVYVPRDVRDVPPPAALVPVPNRGSIVVTRPTPPSEDAPILLCQVEELRRYIMPSGRTSSWLRTDQ